MSTNKRRREIMAFAKTLCPDARMEMSGDNHLRVIFTGPLGTRKVHLSLTPSDHRDAKNSRRDMLRAARTVGLIPANDSRKEG